MKGMLAYDDAIKGKRPGVLIVHEWWGHNKHARDKARKLVEAGYVGIAIDMYGDGKTADHPDDAGKFSSAVASKTSGVGVKIYQGIDFLMKLFGEVSESKEPGSDTCADQP